MRLIMQTTVLLVGKGAELCTVACLDPCLSWASFLLVLKS